MNQNVKNLGVLGRLVIPMNPDQWR